MCDTDGLENHRVANDGKELYLCMTMNPTVINLKSKTGYTTARRWGKFSLGVVIPVHIVRRLNISPDERVEITVRVLRD